MAPLMCTSPWRYHPALLPELRDSNATLLGAEVMISVIFAHLYMEASAVLAGSSCEEDQ